MMKHATVKTGGYTIPLIGIPVTATQQACEKCGRLFHLTEIKFTADGKALCAKCSK
jgi:hypothetical protein